MKDIGTASASFVTLVQDNNRRTHFSLRGRKMPRLLWFIETLTFDITK